MLSNTFNYVNNHVKKPPTGTKTFKQKGLRGKGSSDRALKKRTNKKPSDLQERSDC